MENLDDDVLRSRFRFGLSGLDRWVPGEKRVAVWLDGILMVFRKGEVVRRCRRLFG